MTPHNLCRFIVSNFVTKPDWPKEIKIAKKLIKEFPDENFWVTIPKEQKFDSLCIFIAEFGRNILNKHKNLMSLDLKVDETPKVEEYKIEEDKEFIPNTKTLLQFLRK